MRWQRAKSKNNFGSFGIMLEQLQSNDIQDLVAAGKLTAALEAGNAARKRISNGTVQVQTCF